MVGQTFKLSLHRHKVRRAQAWFDADVIVDALKVKSGDVVLSTGAASGNVFAFLAEDAERVVVVDPNPANLACLRLKCAAFSRLKYGPFLELMGSRASLRREVLLEKCLAHLSDVEQRYWKKRRSTIAKFGVNGVGELERYFRFVRHWVLPFVHNSDTVDALFVKRDAEERREFYSSHWNVWGWRILLRLLQAAPAAEARGMLGAMRRVADKHSLDKIERRMRGLLVDQDPSQNPYLHWMLRGRHGAVLPYAFDEARFDDIKARVDRIEYLNCDLDDIYREDLALDAAYLADDLEGMSERARAAALSVVSGAMKPDGRLFRWARLGGRDPSQLQPLRSESGEAEELRVPNRSVFPSEMCVTVGT